MARAKTAAQRAASKRNLAKARAARRRHDGNAGKIFTKSNRWVARGHSPAGRVARGAVLGVGAAYTPYGFAYVGSGIRKAANKPSQRYGFTARAYQNARDRVG